jgi:hypothetical protein
MSTEASEHERQLALRLHVLAKMDRDWLLGQIGESARSRMDALLLEISALGFNIDAQTLSDAFSSAASHPLSSLLETMNNLQPGWLVQLLKSEPAAITTVINDAHDWQWQASLEWQNWLRSMSTRSLQKAKPTLRVKQALFKAVLRRAAESGSNGFAPSVATPKRDLVNRWSEWCGRWRGAVPWQR